MTALHTSPTDRLENLLRFLDESDFDRLIQTLPAGTVAALRADEIDDDVVAQVTHALAALT